MEFHEKLKQLRRQKGLTQEELAQLLYVSRTAVSKWESGRGYPGIDSLKELAKTFSVTVDELLSGEELLEAAREHQQTRERSIRELVFGLLDVSQLLLLFLPLFAARQGGEVLAVSLLGLVDLSAGIRAAYYAVTAAMIIWGVLTLALQKWEQPAWKGCKQAVSLGVQILGILLFVLGLQPYAAVWMFVLLLIKLALLLKKP
jgi:transcriptional regulator with XRE-family HTH domain